MNTLIHLPIERRPRERLLSTGVESLQLEDLIAVLVRTGTVKSDVLAMSKQIAQMLVNGECDMGKLANLPGVGPAKAAVIVAALQLSHSLQQRASYALLDDPSKIYLACQDLLDKPQEQLVVFYLTSRGHSIARDTISLGTANASLIHPREVFRPAILHNAVHIVLAHNHPSGDTTPSLADRETTMAIVTAGRQVGIELLDHIICGKLGFTSLKSDFPSLFS